MAPTKVAILGAGFIADIHLESYTRFVPDAQVTAVFSRSAGAGRGVSRRTGRSRDGSAISTRLIREADCDVIDICLPNFLHHRATLAAARSGRHVIIEKPLCMTLEEADEMIAVCREHGRKLMYAEELCFAPKYERVRALVKEGAVGDIYMLKQLEKHSGPHSDWFWDVEQSGGGVLMDMGCHAFGWFRWMLGGNPTVKSVWATMDTVRHKARTKGEDNSIVVVEFEGGVIGLAEDGWAKPGGMDDRVEVYGTKGVTFADLFRGNSSSDVQRRRLQLRRGEGRLDRGLDVHGVRGGLQPGLSARTASLHRLRAERQDAARDRRGRPRGAGDHLRGVRVRAIGSESAAPDSREGGKAD